MLTGCLGFLLLSDLRAEETLDERISTFDVALVALAPELFRFGIASQQKPIGFKNVIPNTIDSLGDLVTLVLEFPDRIDAVGHATVSEWRDILHNEDAAIPSDFGGFGSLNDFGGANDQNTYRFSSVDRFELPAPSKSGYAMLIHNQAFEQRIGFAVQNAGPSPGEVTVTYFTVAKAGDTVPRQFTPDFTGTTFTEFRPPVVNGTHVVFPASGQNFSGIYAQPLQGGDLSVIAENFSVGGNQFGVISRVAAAPDGTVYFTTEKGIYSAKPDGSDPTIVAVAGSEYAPGKTWNNPRSIDFDGNRLVFDGFDENDGSGVWLLVNVSVPDEVTVKYIAGADTPIPGGTGTFTGAELPVVSGDMVVFQALGDSGYLGVFGWVNDEVFPILKRGDTLDGETVSIGLYGSGSLLGNTLGLAVQFQDFTSAPYLFTIGGNPTVVRFIPGSATFSPTEGFSAKFTGTVGLDYTFQYTDVSDLGVQSTWIDLETIRLGGSEKTVHDPQAVGQPGRAYRMRVKP